ncbi:hypothetical protein BC830DRAFT_653544 [Chytriomyces sp. MP71]|nr:hypothetical protein BC830DRAFT_653544 [Chytriomyces sp. MP71]
MRLLQQIVARFILPTVIGSLLVAAIAVGLFFAKVPTQIDAIQSRLAANARIRFTSNAEASAALIDAVFSHFAQRASVSASLARDFLQLDGAEPSMGSAFTNTTYNSFFAAQLDGNDPSLPSDPSRYSAYYRNDILTLVDFQKTLPDPATVLDNVLRPATLNLKRIKNAQMGFADGGYRVFPLVYNLSNFNPRTQVVCNASYAPPQLAGTIAPYLGVINGDLQVSVSVALFKSSRLFGVFSLALSLDYIASQLASTTIMSNGYIYVMDVSPRV